MKHCDNLWTCCPFVDLDTMQSVKMADEEVEEVDSFAEPGIVSGDEEENEEEEDDEEEDEEEDMYGEIVPFGRFCHWISGCN